MLCRSVSRDDASIASSAKEFPEAALYFPAAGGHLPTALNLLKEEAAAESLHYDAPVAAKCPFDGHRPKAVSKHFLCRV